MIGRLLIAASLLAAPAGADTAWVTNQSDGTVSVVDLDLGEVVATVPVGGQPAGVATQPNLKRVYVVSPDTRTIHEIDAPSRGVTRTLVLADGGPTGIALGPAGDTLYVTDWYAAQVFVIDVEAWKVTEKLKVGASPSGVAVSPDGTQLITADRDDDQVSVIDLKTRERTVIAVGERPFGVTVDAAGHYAYTADVGTDTVSIVDLAEHRLVGTVPTGERPYAVALARGKGFATDQYGETITVFDLTTFEVIDTLDSGEYPEGIATTSDGAQVVYANWFSNSIAIVDADSLETLAEIDVGDGPRAFGQFLTVD